MKIALTIRDFRPERGGGERYAWRLAEAFAKRGHDVCVFAAEVSTLPDGVAAHRVPLGGGPKRLAFARNCARMLEECEGEHDVVHGFGKSLRMDVFRPGGGAHRAWMERDPLSVENPLARRLRRVRRRLTPAQWLLLRHERRQYAGAPFPPEVIANSRMVRDDIRRFYDVPDERIHVIYNGVDTAHFSPANRRKLRTDVRQRHGLSDDDLVLLFVANNFRLKGLRPLIRALARLAPKHPELRLLVVGRGRSASFTRLARNLGCADRIAFAGAAADTAPFYAAADVFAHPTFYDPCANVTLEALASGAPVVTSTRNGAGELIAEGVEGSVIDPEDVAALAQAIESFLAPERRAAAGAAARALAERHGMDRHVDDVLSVYETAQRRKRKP